MSDLENKSFDYKFTKAFVDEKDIELNVIHVSNSQLEESKELDKGLRDPTSTENLAFDIITQKKVKKYLEYVRLDDDGETILIEILVKSLSFLNLKTRRKSFD
jgi:hypothetical protein